jgi:hypothetical protein
MGRSAFALALGLAVSGCGLTAHRPASRARVTDPLSQSIPPDASAVWLGLSGCDRAASQALGAKLQRIEMWLREDERGLDRRTVDAELAAAWTSPCLTHIARFSRRPQVETFAELREIWGWRAGLYGASSANA